MPRRFGCWWTGPRQVQPGSSVRACSRGPGHLRGRRHPRRQDRSRSRSRSAFARVYVASLLLASFGSRATCARSPRTARPSCCASDASCAPRKRDCWWHGPDRSSRCSCCLGPERQLSQEVLALPAGQREVAGSDWAFDRTASIPAECGSAYLTGDGNVVLLNATLIYRINDPMAYALEQTHVAAALDRLFRATTVRVTAGRNLNDFLVVQAAQWTGCGQSGGRGAARRGARLAASAR